ncbi:hypothetical protein [Cedecea colo]|uniref:Uncharacterized protein n=1 Tax=Cedecea colo TaxID=2552946 RepID=A0ABX0VL26_9ENTR|nr:hypothetical protein [Cedecea colo]NIY47266.1 hypothetical protein [Cedecea colo]
MTPSMYERVRNMLVDAGLTAGYKVQLLLFEDTGNLKDAFIVFSPGGGTPIRDDISSDYYVDVTIVGAKENRKGAAERMQQIIDYVRANPTKDECLNYIESMGIPSPMPTTEGRIVFSLRFRCVYGD